LSAEKAQFQKKPEGKKPAPGKTRSAERVE